MLAENSSFKKEGSRDIDVVRVMLVRDANSSYRTKPIKDPNDVVSVARNFLANEDREMFIVINLDCSKKINSIHVVAIGSVDAALVHPREIFKAAILSNASSVVLAHNHPSGNPQPSDQDRQITSKLIEAGNLLGIKVLDHVIVGDSEYSCLVTYEDRNGEKISWDTRKFKDSQAAK